MSSNAPSRTGLLLRLAIFLSLGIYVATTFGFLFLQKMAATRTDHVIPYEYAFSEKPGVSPLVAFSVFEPKRAQKPYPVAYLLHGQAANRNSLHILATELARVGILAVTIDAPQHGHSTGLHKTGHQGCSELYRTIDVWIQERYEINPNIEDIAYIGHSMGAFILDDISLDRDSPRPVIHCIALGGPVASTARDSLWVYGLLKAKDGRESDPRFTAPLVWHPNMCWHPSVIAKSVTTACEWLKLSEPGDTFVWASLDLLLIAGSAFSSFLFAGLLLRSMSRKLNIFPSVVGVLLGLFATGLLLLLNGATGNGYVWMLFPPSDNLIAAMVFVPLLALPLAITNLVGSMRFCVTRLFCFADLLLIPLVGALWVQNMRGEFLDVRLLLKVIPGGFLIALLGWLPRSFIGPGRKGNFAAMTLEVILAWLWIAQCILV